MNFDIGCRIRFAADINTTNLEPGNEFVFRGEGGYYPLNNLLVKVAVSGLYGTRFNQGDFELLDSERRVVYVEPSILLTIRGSLVFETGVQATLSGKNFPAGLIYHADESDTLFV